MRTLLTIVGLLLMLGLAPTLSLIAYGTNDHVFGILQTNEYTIGKMINGTNEGSYLHGWWQGSLTGPRYDPGSNWYPNSENYTCALNGGQVLEYPPKVNGVVDPAVTNTTACQDGFFNGWKYWCINHAVNCVGNITSGYLPEMLVKTHQEYLRGYNTANGSYNLCPIGANAAFCTGWFDNHGESSECAEQNYTGSFASHSLIGCPLDTMNSNQMAKPRALIGTWNYVNGTISGKIVYSDYGNFTLTIPTKNALGDYKLEGSWGSLGTNILTECYPYGDCENNTLTTITPNHIEFQDPQHDVIHLIRDPFPPIQPSWNLTDIINKQANICAKELKIRMLHISKFCQYRS